MITRMPLCGSDTAAVIASGTGAVSTVVNGEHFLELIEEHDLSFPLDLKALPRIRANRRGGVDDGPVATGHAPEAAPES